MDVVSASHYDGGAATAEAALMTCRATRRERLLVSRGVHPHYRETLATYADGAGLQADEIPLIADGPLAGTTDLEALERLLADPEHPVAGVVVAQPNILGLLEDMPASAASPTRPARCSCRSSSPCRSRSSPRPASTARTSPPARASRSGIPLNYGGPYLGHRRLHRRAGPPDPGPPRRRHRPTSTGGGRS